MNHKPAFKCPSGIPSLQDSRSLSILQQETSVATTSLAKDHYPVLTCQPNLPEISLSVWVMVRGEVHALGSLLEVGEALCVFGEVDTTVK